MVEAGALLGTFPTGDPVVDRDNTWGFDVQFDCGGPNEPAYNGYEYPGQPILYAGGPQPCPSGNEVAAVHYAGDVYRYSLWLSGLDWYLLHPPIPPTSAPLSGVEHVPHGNDLYHFHGGIEWLTETIDLLLASGAGAVNEWFDRVLPRALAEAAAGSHANWQFLRPMPGWYGRLETQIRSGIAVLRGTLRCWTDELDQLTVVASWPTGFGASWPSWYGYVLPDVIRAGTAPTFIAHLADGTAVPMLLANASGGLRTFVIDNQWAVQYTAAHTGYEQIDLDFDGIQIAVDYP